MRLASIGAFTRRLLGLLLLPLLLAACGGGGGDGGAAPAPTPAAAEAQLEAVVFDTQGLAVAGATLRSASATAVTGADGRASLPVPTGSEQAVRVEKEGFAEQVKVVNLAAGATSAPLQAMLIAREAPLELAAAEAGGSVSGQDGVKVTLPAGALVTPSGQAVSGAVQLQMTPLDVTTLDLGAFPGIFEGLAGAGGRSMILSYGSAELVPQQGGQKLQLAAGASAEIELPLYASKHKDGRAVLVGDKIALWSLDAATGLWKQEGEGTIVASAASPTGLAMRATITHFSWWNCDDFVDDATVTLTVRVPGETVPPGTTASVGGQTAAADGAANAAATEVLVDAPTPLTVPAGVATRLTATVLLGDRTCFGSIEVQPQPDSNVAAVIDTLCVVVPVPRITRPGDLSATNSSRDVSINVLVDGPRADSVEVFVGSTRIAQFNAAIQVQPFFRAFLDSTSLAEGTHQITARATRQGVSRDSAPITLVVDRTPPELVQIDPVPGAEVSQSTTFTLDFSEPVNALPFALADALRLAVTPPDGATPQTLPIDAQLSSDGRRLTVQPRVEVPLGALALAFGALKDAAGNALAGTQSVSFAIERSPFLFAQAQGRPIAFGPPVALASDGRIIVAFNDGDGNLHVEARAGSSVTPFGAPADNPVGSNGGNPFYDLVLDSADRPHVALMQVAGGVNRVVVRRFEGGAWQDLGPAFIDVAARPLRLLIDGSGRPVLAVHRTDFLVEVHRFDAASGNWNSLGAPTAAIGGNLDNHFDLALLPNGDPVIALVQGIFASNATLLKAARHDGSGWVQLGGTLDSTPNATQSIGRPNIVGGANGPWLHYVKTGGVLRLLRFDGSDWEINDLPKPAGANSLQNPNALVLLNDDPVIAFNDFSLGVFVTRFSGAAFDEPFSAIGRPSQLSLAARGDSVVIGAQDFGATMIVERLLFP